jgi:hypothetical protein
MNANELLQKVKMLTPLERRRFFRGAHKLEEPIESQTPPRPKRPIRWPDAAARRRKIFSDKVYPNMVLAERYQTKSDQKWIDEALASGPVTPLTKKQMKAIRDRVLRGKKV